MYLFLYQDLYQTSKISISPKLVSILGSDSIAREETLDD